VIFMDKLFFRYVRVTPTPRGRAAKFVAYYTDINEPHNVSSVSVAGPTRAGVAKRCAAKIFGVSVGRMRILRRLPGTHPEFYRCAIRV